jgi:hypothetical protein
LRLWDQGERVEEMFGYYEKFDDELKAKLPLKWRQGVALAKPKETRLGAVDKLPSYLGLKFRKIAILIDQEEEDIDSIISQVEDRLEGWGLTLTLRT